MLNAKLPAKQHIHLVIVNHGKLVLQPVNRALLVYQPDTQPAVLVDRKQGNHKGHCCHSSQTLNENGRSNAVKAIQSICTYANQAL